ncbi:MAG: hypothetical protein IJP68_05825 [Selenomonadaceae bacterium]|nr:hypothetical protein [Selenomonadaceae bacterium]
MRYIKIGSAYFNPDKIKGYHIRGMVDKDSNSQWQVRADTMHLRIFDSKLKAEEYLDFVIGKLEGGNENQENAD